MSNQPKGLEPDSPVADSEVKIRLAWSIDAMIHAKARTLGVMAYPYLIDSIILKAFADLDAGRNVLLVFFAARDEAEILLGRQEKANKVIDQLLGLVRQTSDQNPMAKHQAI